MFIGIDLGTSGCRAIAIDAQAQIQGEARVNLATPPQQNKIHRQNPSLWWDAVCNVLDQLSHQIFPQQQIQAIAVDGTSASVLAIDAQGKPLGKALMYNDASCQTQAQYIQRVAPADSVARSATSSLAKLLYLYQQYPHAHYVLHQADWISNCLAQDNPSFKDRMPFSDENNCLKLGYDAQQGCWSKWLKKLDFPASLLPNVLPPGSAYATLRPDLAQRWNFSLDTKIVTGTTDSTAAFIATGVEHIGDAVTMLGSTLVLKMLSDKPINAPEYGIYSHRLGKQWLVGGASNSGGAVLLQHFSTEQLTKMTPQLKPRQPTGFDYYPLPSIGERFPIANSELAPRLTPRPADDVIFFQGMLEGLSIIEQQGYARLHELGAPELKTVRTVGGGAKNAAWSQMREIQLGVPVITAQQTEAAYGTALLAQKGLSHYTNVPLT